MRRFSLLILLMLIIGLPTLVAQNIFNSTYDIYYATSYGSDLSTTNGAYLKFSLGKAGHISYDYFISEEVHKTGRVLDFRETSDEINYVLQGFFPGEKNASISITKTPESDNMRTAVIFFANQKEDSIGVFDVHILLER